MTWFRFYTFNNCKMERGERHISDFVPLSIDEKAALALKVGEM